MQDTVSVEALKRSYDRYGERAYRVAVAICGESPAAEDAVVSAFASIRWGVENAEPTRTLARLLCGVREHAIEIARSSRGERTPGAAMLASLPDSEHEVIVLALYGGMADTEIAEHLGLPCGEVRARMGLGLRRLTV